MQFTTNSGQNQSASVVWNSLLVGRFCRILCQLINAFELLLVHYHYVIDEYALGLHFLWYRNHSRFIFSLIPSRSGVSNDTNGLDCQNCRAGAVISMIRYFSLSVCVYLLLMGIDMTSCSAASLKQTNNKQQT